MSEEEDVDKFGRELGNKIIHKTEKNMMSTGELMFLSFLKEGSF